MFIRMINKSKVMQGLKIFIAIIFIIAILSYVWHGTNKQYIKKYNQCVSDCERAGQAMFGYQNNAFTTPRCFCILDDEVNGIW